MPPPKDLKFEFAAVENYRKVIDEQLHTPDLLDQPLDEELFSSYRYKAMDVLGIDQENPNGITTTLMFFYGSTLSCEKREQISWRLAAGRQLLVRDKPLLRVFEPVDGEWLALRIEDVAYGRLTKIKRHPTVDVTFRIMSGVFGGLTFKQNIAYVYFARKIAREIGFPKYKRFHKNETVQCWLAGNLVVTPDEGPRLTEFHATSAVKTRVKQLRDLRLTPCPREFPWPCYKCHVGHAADDRSIAAGEMPCHRATHLRTLTQKLCSKCKEMSWFDPGINSEVCLSCALEPIKYRLKQVCR